MPHRPHLLAVVVTLAATVGCDPLSGGKGGSETPPAGVCDDGATNLNGECYCGFTQVHPAIGMSADLASQNVLAACWQYNGGDAGTAHKANFPCNKTGKPVDVNPADVKKLENGLYGVLLASAPLCPAGEQNGLYTWYFKPAPGLGCDNYELAGANLLVFGPPQAPYDSVPQNTLPGSAVTCPYTVQ